jgi:hypothetical protein
MSEAFPTLLDEHLVLICPMHEALAVLGSVDAVRSWFGARTTASGRVVIGSGSDRIALHPTRSVFDAAGPALVSDGVIESTRYHAHLTLRRVVRSTPAGLGEGTEVWVHCELRGGTPDTVVSVRAAIRAGLEHVRLELDA